jgi:hypothetical protein
MSDQHWIEFLEDEDLAFLKRFILASGSLKELAQAYGISYPTVRLRLDRLINKIKIFDSQNAISDFERTLRGMYVDGKIDLASLKTLLAAHRKEKENELETNSAPTSVNHLRAIDVDQLDVR